MDYTNEILERLQKGEAIEDIAAKLTEDLNTANEQYKAEQEAKAKEAAKRKENTLKVEAVNFLIDALVEIGEAPVNTEKLQKGRRKILIDINVNSRFALGATVDEKEVSIGLTNLNSEVLDKASMVIDDRTTSKDIINYIIKTSNEMVENSALTKD